MPYRRLNGSKSHPKQEKKKAPQGDSSTSSYHKITHTEIKESPLLTSHHAIVFGGGATDHSIAKEY